MILPFEYFSLDSVLIRFRVCRIGLLCCENGVLMNIGFGFDVGDSKL